MRKNLSYPRASFRLKIISIFLFTCLADFLFYGHPIGWTLGLFGVLLTAGFTVIHCNVLDSWTGRAILLLTVSESLILIEKSSLLSFILMLTGIVSLVLLSKGGWRQDAIIWARKVLDFWMFLLNPLSKAACAYHRYRRRYLPQSTMSGFIRGWFLPVGLSLVFIMLFSNANPIITGWISALNINSFISFLSFWRLFFWFFVGGFIFAVIRPKIISQKVKKTQVLLEEARTKRMRFSEWAFTKEAVLRSLVIFNLIFGCQTLLDMNYLWAGTELPRGITYARYAQQGAYPLIVTALLAAVFVLIAQNAGPDVSGSKQVRGLIYLWVAQNVLLVVSSIYRTTLYVEVYALSYWRVAAFIWMGLVASGLCWIIVRSMLNKSNRWLINANVLTLLGVLYITSFVNIGGLIADYNVAHSREVSGKGVNLDVDYLTAIGSPAIPALKRYSERIDAPLSDTSVVYAMIHSLRRDMDDWRRWTYSEYRLLKSLERKEEWQKQF